jgi:3-hydroxyisobutyrate dehydrogenase
MGRQLAKHLLSTSELAVWDLNREATEEFQKAGAIVPITAAELAAQCRVIFLCLPRSADVRNLIFGPAGLLDGLAPGTIIIDQTSGIPDQTRSIARDLEHHGVLMLDAPVAGGVAAAVAGRITVMVSGPRAAYDAVLPVLSTISNTVMYCGERVGDGQAIKAVNNVMNAACRLLNLEVIAMGRKAGLPLAGMIETINQSSGRSRISEVALPALLAGKPSSDFALALMVKDVDQAITMGMDVGAAMPIAALTRSLLQMGVNTMGPSARLEDMVTVIGNLSGTSLYAKDEHSSDVEVLTDTALDRKPVIGYVGLGAMGSALARQALQVAGELYVYDISPERTRALVEQGAYASVDLPSLARACDVIMLCVPGAAEVRETLFGEEGMAAGLTAGKIIVDQTTGSPVETRALAIELERLGVALIDAPVAGGPAGAADGSLLSLCGGSGPAYVTAVKLLHAMGSKVSHFGPTGNGHAAKLVKNALGACNRLITYEAVSMAVKLGLQLDVLADVINKSSGWTAAFQRIVPAIGCGKATAEIRLKLFSKDLRLICEMAVACGVPMLIANIVRATVEAAVNELGEDVNIDELGRLFDLDVLHA